MAGLITLKSLVSSQPKVFCLGFNKSGTTSLHDFFLKAGLLSIHDHNWPALSHARFGKLYFRRAQCFSDGEQANFTNLLRWFPDAQFILNTRDERKWLMSRIKHVLRYGDAPPFSQVLERRDFGPMAADFFYDPEIAIRKWIVVRRLYEGQVRAYFADKPGFIEVDVTTEPDWAEKLGTHFRNNGLKSHPVAQPIHANKRSTEAVSDQTRLSVYTELMDKILSTDLPDTAPLK